MAEADEFERLKSEYRQANERIGALIDKMIKEAKTRDSAMSSMMRISGKSESALMVELAEERLRKCKGELF